MVRFASSLSDKKLRARRMELIKDIPYLQGKKHKKALDEIKLLVNEIQYRIRKKRLNSNISQKDIDIKTEEINGLKIELNGMSNLVDKLDIKIDELKKENEELKEEVKELEQYKPINERQSMYNLAAWKYKGNCEAKIEELKKRNEELQERLAAKNTKLMDFFEKKNKYCWAINEGLNLENCHLEKLRQKHIAKIKELEEEKDCLMKQFDAKNWIHINKMLKKAEKKVKELENNQCVLSLCNSHSFAKLAVKDGCVFELMEGVLGFHNTRAEEAERQLRLLERFMDDSTLVSNAQIIRDEDKVEELEKSLAKCSEMYFRERRIRSRATQDQQKAEKERDEYHKFSTEQGDRLRELTEKFDKTAKRINEIADDEKCLFAAMCMNTEFDKKFIKMKNSVKRRESSLRKLAKEVQGSE